MKPDEEEGSKGRKRKKPDVKETSEECGEAVPPTGEIDPITATIEAVLASASAFHSSVDKPKKVKRAKKQQLEGNLAKTPKQDGAADDNNDDDSSTAGNEVVLSITSCCGFLLTSYQC